MRLMMNKTTPKRIASGVFAVLSLVEMYFFIFVFSSSKYYYISEIDAKYCLLLIVAVSIMVLLCFLFSFLWLNKNPTILLLVYFFLSIVCFVSTVIMLYVSWGTVVAKEYLACLLIFSTAFSGLIACGLSYLVVQRNNKIVKNIFRILISVFISIVFTSLIPIKLCVISLPQSEEEFYVVQLNTGCIIGDHKGIYRDSADRVLSASMYQRNSKFYSVVIKRLSQDIWWDVDTLFIVYGHASIEEVHSGADIILEYSIDVTDWDVYGEVKTINPVRTLFSKNYLTIYDYYWFDVVRDRLFNYLDGATYF